MAAGYNTYTLISSFVNTIFEDALFVARESTLAVNLATVFRDQTGMALRKNQVYGTATINSIGETDDLVSQTFTPTALSTLTPAEFGAQFLLTDQRLESDPFGVRQDAAMELGAAMAEKIDKDLLGNFNAFTGGTVGTSGSALTWGYFYAMLARLRAQNAPPPYTFVCHPHQWHRLASAASVAGSGTNAADSLLEEIAARYYVGTYSGVRIFVSSNVEASSTDYYVGMFSPMAMAYDERRAPRLEPERDASRRAWELNLSGVYAHGVWRPAFGIQGVFDGAAPTS